MGLGLSVASRAHQRVTHVCGRIFRAWVVLPNYKQGKHCTHLWNAVTEIDKINYTFWAHHWEDNAMNVSQVLMI